MHGRDFDFSFVRFSDQVVKRILGDRIYAAYSLIFLSRARKEVSQSSQVKKGLKKKFTTAGSGDVDKCHL